jgi:hypothetical protein
MRDGDADQLFCSGGCQGVLAAARAAEAKVPARAGAVTNATPWVEHHAVDGDTGLGIRPVDRDLDALVAVVDEGDEVAPARRLDTGGQIRHDRADTGCRDHRSDDGVERVGGGLRGGVPRLARAEAVAGECGGPACGPDVNAAIVVAPVAWTASATRAAGSRGPVEVERHGAAACGLARCLLIGENVLRTIPVGPPGGRRSGRPALGGPLSGRIDPHLAGRRSITALAKPLRCVGCAARSSGVTTAPSASAEA